MDKSISQMYKCKCIVLAYPKIKYLDAFFEQVYFHSKSFFCMLSLHLAMNDKAVLITSSTFRLTGSNNPLQHLSRVNPTRAALCYTLHDILHLNLAVDWHDLTNAFALVQDKNRHRLFLTEQMRLSMPRLRTRFHAMRMTPVLKYASFTHPIYAFLNTPALSSSPYACENWFLPSALKEEGAPPRTKIHKRQVDSSLCQHVTRSYIQSTPLRWTLHRHLDRVVLAYLCVWRVVQAE